MLGERVNSASRRLMWRLLQSVITDYDEFALVMAKMNIALNELDHICCTAKYDW